MESIRKKEKINVAVVGCGGAGYHHAKNLLGIKEVNKVIGVEINKENREKIHNDLKIEVTSDYREIVDSKDIDAVAIATANQFHAEIAIAFLNNWKDVLCEKPMALNEKDARSMVDIARKNKRILHIGFELRNSILPLRVKDIINNGEIGEIVSMYLYHARGAFWPKWKGDKNISGGEFLMETCHAIDLFRWWTGKEITEVYSVAPKTIIPYYNYADTNFTNYFFENGIIGHTTETHVRSADPYINESDWEQPQFGHEYNWTVVGTKGSLVFKPVNKFMNVYKFEERENGYFCCRLIREEKYNDITYSRLFHDIDTEDFNFIKAVVEGKDTNVTPEDALRTHLVCFSALKSQEDKKLIKIVY